MGYSDLFRELAGYFGPGLGKGAMEEIQAREGERRAMESFRRLAPQREAEFQEKLGYETRMGRAKGELESEFKLATEAREAESARATVGPYLSEVLGTTEFPGAAGERRQEVQTPYDIPEVARKEDIYKLLGVAQAREKVARPTRGRAPTMTELYIAASQGDPTAKAALKQYEETQVGGLFGGKERLRGSLPPDITPTDREGMLFARQGLEKAGELDRMLAEGGERFVGPYAGSELYAGARRRIPEWMGGGLTGPEADIRAGLASLGNAIVRSQAGLAQTEGEVRRQKLEVPQMTDPPTEIRRKLALTRKNLQDNLNLREQMLRAPRRMQPGQRPGLHPDLEQE